MRLIYKNGCQLALAIDSMKLRESMLALAEKKNFGKPKKEISESQSTAQKLKQIPHRK